MTSRNSDTDMGTPLYMCDVTGMALAQAAHAYAVAGWYVLPVAPGSKNPGGVVGGDWCSQSSRDADQIAAWWAENPNYGIALHVGRSGAVAFDLDHSNYVLLVTIAEDGRPDIADALETAGAINGTRSTGDRGHYLFLMPAGQEFGNSAGAFGRWGEVRGKNGVIIVAPTPHPDQDDPEKIDAEHDCYPKYYTKRAGALTPLPDVLRDCLSEAKDSADPLFDHELDEFLDEHNAVFGCGHDGCRHSIKGQVTKFTTETNAGESRHKKMCFDVLPWAFREAIAGCYPAREALDALKAEWDKAIAATGEQYRSDEFTRLAAWAAAQAQADPQSKQVHGDEPAQVHRQRRLTAVRASEVKALQGRR
jgi:hypothetical protein